MTVEELKVRLCEEIKFNNDGYNNMCEVLEEFSEAQKPSSINDYATAVKKLINSEVDCVQTKDGAYVNLEGVIDCLNKELLND